MRRKTEQSEHRSRSSRHLNGANRLHRGHWFVLAFSLLLTLTASYITRTQIQEKVEDRFDRQTDQAVALVLERLARYEDGLWGGVAAIESNGGDMTHDEWLGFATSLDIDQRYPGINGIGVIHNVAPAEVDQYLTEQRSLRPDYAVHPEHEEDIFLPITYIEPAAPNAAAVGLDMAHEANRYDGVKRAREFGSAQITGPIVLVQDKLETPGFLLFAPWYDGGDPVEVERRRTQFSGVVYAPFIVNTLMHGALDETEREVGISITDQEVVLYDEHRPEIADFDPDPLFRREVRLPIYGRSWTFDIWSARSFRDSASNNEPLTILIGGLILEALLFAFFWSMTSANKKAIRLASVATSELRQKTARLEQSNAELEQFAYVASHDLKTPMRGIADLAEFLNEDLEEYLNSTEANPDVARHLARIGQQTSRMNSLIDGILDYSRIGGDASGSAGWLDLVDFTSQIRENLALEPAQLVFTGVQELHAPASVYLEQVLQNLISNAVTHHHDPSSAEIVVDVTRVGGHHTVSVSDNGPGIDPRHHERIFQVFQRLSTDTEGTGIGLAIVKKIIENQGSQITLVSAPDKGSTFSFDWPTAEDPTIPARPSATARFSFEEEPAWAST